MSEYLVEDPNMKWRVSRGICLFYVASRASFIPNLSAAGNLISFKSWYKHQILQKYTLEGKGWETQRFDMATIFQYGCHWLS